MKVLLCIYKVTQTAERKRYLKKQYVLHEGLPSELSEYIMGIQEANAEKN